MSLLSELVNGPSASERYTSMLSMLPGFALSGMGGMSPQAGNYPGNLRGWVNEAIDLTGVPQSWLKPLLELAQRESGGNPRAYNDTPVASGQHAQGLFQTIPSTFAAHNMPRLGGIYDPVANAVAAIRYIQGRYGSPFNLPSSGGY